MQFQRLLDAGVHPEVVNKARAQSIDPGTIMALINTMLSLFTTGGGQVINAIMNLLSLFHILPGPSPTPSGISFQQRREQLIASGVDEHLLSEAEAKALDPSTVVTWITNILNAITVAGPSLVAAIAAILKLFTPATPPAPAPTPSPAPVKPH